MAKSRQAANASETYWEEAILQRYKQIPKGLGGRAAEGGTRSYNGEESCVIPGGGGNATFQQRIEHARCSEITRTQIQGALDLPLMKYPSKTLSPQRWDRLVDICMTKKLLASEPFEKTRWKEFLDMVETLGKDGMSPDKSTEEEGTYKKCYRVRSSAPAETRFRRDHGKRFEQSGHSKSGSVPTPRYRQDRRLASSKDAPATVRISLLPPVTKLPAAFYDDDWTSMRSTEYVHGVLCGSDQGYEWVVRVAEAYSGQGGRGVQRARGQ